MLTTRQLRDQHARLLLGCGCGWQRHVELATAPDEILDLTVESLHAGSRRLCPGCGRRPPAIVYAFEGGLTRQVERYHED